MGNVNLDIGLDEAWKQVRQFQKTFKQPERRTPALLPERRVHLRRKWMLEELDEFLEATEIVDQADAMIDLLYFVVGTLVEMGVRPAPLFRIVHAANMHKVWSDGEPRFESDGKPIKPGDWADPAASIRQAIDSMQNDLHGEQDW